MIGANPATREALDRLCGIARQAGATILRCAAVPASRLKADGSPVTLADLAAQRVVVSGLRDWDDTIPILAEESIAASAGVRGTWQRWWLVDPLDGTKEFLSGNGEFTVNIALIDEGTPVLGVIYAPALRLLYCAGRGLGAWRQAGSAGAVRIASTEWRSGQPARVVESRSHPSAELEAWLASIRVVQRIRLGSSLKFCRVAEGAADLYPRFGPTMEWDVAAGDCIYRNATPKGERPSPFSYNTPDLRVPGFILGAKAR